LATLTWGSLVVGVALLALFTFAQQRAESPLLPLRVLVNRTRGGSLVALFFTNIGIFGMFLFLAYYLQGAIGYSPLRTGFAFLPLVIALAVSAFIASARLLAKVGPRPLVPTGMILATMGMVLFTKLTPNSDYWVSVLPGLVVTGLGLGLIVAPAVASATEGVEAHDAGAASALVNTTQQIGGSVGIALLNTIAVSVAARAVRGLPAPPAKGTATGVLAQLHATIHGYTVSFWWAAGLFGVGAVLSFALLESGVPELDANLVALP
jgi:MFS family permease